VKEFERTFSHRNEVHIHFSEEAIDELVEKIWLEAIDPKDYLRQAFQNYEHGLKLIKEKTGRQEFLISAEGMANPDIFLNRLIRETYRGE